MSEVTATEAARKAADLLDAVEHDGERYTITRRGRAVARVEPIMRGRGSDAKALLRRNRPGRRRRSDGRPVWVAPSLDFSGDFGAALFDDAGRVELYGSDGELLIGSSLDLTFIHPPSSPLPGGGNAAASYVIAEAGRHTIKVDTSGDYVAQFRAFRPLGESEDRPSQILFVDFDGGSVDPGIYFGGPFGFEVELSPLSAFLAGWGLAPGDEDAVIDAILASVEENIDHDIEAFGSNGEFDIDLRNSRDHDDPWGDPNVSRIIVGGTIPELGIPTIGIAQSIDVGNFATEETAVVLLDLLSGTGPFPAPDVDLNLFPLDPSVSIIDIVGEAVGSITAHEAGHFFANWHTDQFNPTANVMDQGGNLPGLLGVGPDGVFGSSDDVDVDFGHDTFVPNEGFTGPRTHWSPSRSASGQRSAEHDRVAGMTRSNVMPAHRHHPDIATATRRPEPCP